MADARELVVKVTGDTADFEKSADGLSSKLGGMGKAAGVAGVAAAGGIAAIGGTLLSVAGTFDDAFDGMRTQTGLTGAAADDLNASFKNVFGSGANDAETVSAAMGTLSQRTGATGATLEGLTTQVANLSRITGTDATANANAAADAFAKWGVDTDEQADRMDELFAASQKSGISFEQLAGTVATNQAAFHASGLTMGESIGLVARLGQAGIDTAEVMPGLSKALGAAMKAGKDPGEELAATFAKIQSEGANSETAMKTFGKSGVKMAEAIASGALTLDDLSTSLGDTTNAINNTATDTADFGEKFDEFKNKLMVAIEPAATKLMDSLTEAMTKLEPMIPPVADALARFFGFLSDNPVIAMVVAAVGALGAAFGAIMVVVGPFIPIIMSVVSAFGALGGIVGGIVALFNPVTIAIGLIVAAVVGLKLAWDNNLGGIQEKTAAIVEAVKAFFSDMVAGIGAALTAIGEAIIAAWNLYWGTINTVLTTIVAVITTAWNTVTTIISDALDAIWSTLKLRWDAFLREISDKLDAILGAVGKAWTAITDAIDVAMKAIAKVISDLWEQARAAVDTALTAIGKVVDTVFGAVKSVVETVMKFVHDIIDTQINGARIIVETALGLIKTAFDTVLGALKGIAETAMKGVTAAFDVLSGIATTVRGYLDGITGTLSEWAGLAVTAFTGAGTALVDGIVAGINGGLGLVQDIIGTLAALLPQWLRDVLGWHSPATISMPAGAAVAEGFGLGFIEKLNSDVLPEMSRALTRGLDGILHAPPGGPTPPPDRPDIGRGKIISPGGPVPDDMPYFPRYAPRRVMDVTPHLNATTRQGRGGFRAGFDWSTYHGLPGAPAVPAPRKGAGGAAEKTTITGPVTFSGTINNVFNVDGAIIASIMRTGQWNVQRNRAAA